MVPFERATVVSYRLSVVNIIVLSQPQLAVECLRCSNQQGWGGSLWGKIWGRRFDNVA